MGDSGCIHRGLTIGWSGHSPHHFVPRISFQSLSLAELPVLCFCWVMPSWVPAGAELWFWAVNRHPRTSQIRILLSWIFCSSLFITISLVPTVSSAYIRHSVLFIAVVEWMNKWVSEVIHGLDYGPCFARFAVERETGRRWGDSPSSEHMLLFSRNTAVTTSKLESALLCPLA